MKIPLALDTYRAISQFAYDSFIMNEILTVGPGTVVSYLHLPVYVIQFVFIH